VQELAPVQSSPALDSGAFFLARNKMRQFFLRRIWRKKISPKICVKKLLCDVFAHGRA
jgi:hypothetical protein